MVAHHPRPRGPGPWQSRFIFAAISASSTHPAACQRLVLLAVRQDAIGDPLSGKAVRQCREIQGAPPSYWSRSANPGRECGCPAARDSASNPETDRDGIARMPDVYVKRLHGVDYTKLKGSAPAEARGEFPPPRAAPAGHPWKTVKSAILGVEKPPGAASIHAAFAPGRCRSNSGRCRPWRVRSSCWPIEGREVHHHPALGEAHGGCPPRSRPPPPVASTMESRRVSRSMDFLSHGA